MSFDRCGIAADFRFPPKKHDAAWRSNWRKARETAIRQKSAKMKVRI
jgi:hypothetical protein